MQATKIRHIDYAPPQSPFLEIIYEDEDMVVCNKQAGLLSVPGRKDEMKDCLESRLKTQFDNIFTIHRLDMETSGLIVYAKNKDAQRKLSQLFMDKKIQKTYVADVYGHPDLQKGIIDLPLICDWPNRPKQKVDFDVGKKAETHWEIINQSAQHSRVKLTPITGRSHQLRVHMLELGHPILGDSLYAHDDAYAPYKRLHLHAHTLSFTHPNTNKTIRLTSETNF